MKRWLAKIIFRSESYAGMETALEIEELSELHDLVELGPNWNAIERIEITLARGVSETTIEQSANDGDDRAARLINRAA